MNTHHDDPWKSLAARITEVEGVFTHLQRMVQDLNQVVIAQQGRLDRMEMRLRQLAASLDAAGASDPPPTLEDERPPHY